MRGQGHCSSSPASASRSKLETPSEEPGLGIVPLPPPQLAPPILLLFSLVSARVSFELPLSSPSASAPSLLPICLRSLSRSLMDAIDDVRTLDSELRSIRLDDGPKLQPFRLDKMFLRARQWKGSAPQVGPIRRPPSPPRRAAVFPLPKPLPHGSAVSPLAGLFDYPELLPLVLKDFDQARDLVVLSRVNRAFCKIARRRLYEHVWVRPCDCSASALCFKF